MRLHLDALTEIVLSHAGALIRISEADRVEAMAMLSSLISAFRGESETKIVTDPSLSSGSISVEVSSAREDPAG